MYSTQLLDHFEHPRNAGELIDADASAEIENPVCGDIVRISLKLKDGKIADLRFKAKGCVPAIACGSAVTTLALGKLPIEAGQIKVENIVDAVGGLPPASNHAAQLALDALRAALAKV